MASQCKDYINSRPKNLPKLQFSSTPDFPHHFSCKRNGVFTLSKKNGWHRYCRGPKKNMLGRYQYPLHKASELGNARPGAWDGEFPGGSGQVSNEGPRLLGRPCFSPKDAITLKETPSDFYGHLVLGASSLYRFQINENLGAICLVKEVDDKTIPGDTSGLRDTTNKYPPKILLGKWFDCCFLLSLMATFQDPVFHRSPREPCDPVVC